MERGVPSVCAIRQVSKSTERPDLRLRVMHSVQVPPLTAMSEHYVMAVSFHGTCSASLDTPNNFRCSSYSTCCAPAGTRRC